MKKNLILQKNTLNIKYDHSKKIKIRLLNKFFFFKKYFINGRYIKNFFLKFKKFFFFYFNLFNFFFYFN